jgi:diadenosine tetraphosphatase ApaH/serine/threonine PP2A family protein phosphatase
MGSATLVHASLRDPIMEYVMDAITAEENLRGLSTPILFHGHTHIPALWELRGEVANLIAPSTEPVALRAASLINAGSVGQPRDRDPRAAWLLWERDEESAGLGRVTWRRVEYDIPSAQEAIDAAGLPDSLASRLAVGR